MGGVIETVSDGVVLATGTTMAVEPTHGCGTCQNCLGGFPNRCRSLTLFGVTANGGMADLLVVPEHCVYPLAAGVSATMGTLGEPLAVCLRAVRLANVKPGDRVAVLGAGSIGLWASLRQEPWVPAKSLPPASVNDHIVRQPFG